MEAEALIGRSEEEATREAIRRFGDARTVGRGLLRAWRRGNPSWLASPIGAVFVALGTDFAIRKLLSGTGVGYFLIKSFQKVIDLSWLQYEPSFVVSGVQALLYCVMVVLLSGLPAILVGALTGYLSPKRAVPASVAVLLLPLFVQHLQTVASGAALLRLTVSGPMYRLGMTAGQAAGEVVTHGWAFYLWGVVFATGAAAHMAKRRRSAAAPAARA